MNLGQIIQRAIKELYNNPGTSTSFLTPEFAVHALNDIILSDYWSVFQDKEYSYYKTSELVLPVVPNQNLYPLPNGDPAQVDVLTFSLPPTSGNWALDITQGSTFHVTGLGPSDTAATLQAAINAATGGAPSVSVTGNYTIGFTLLWDLTSVSAITLSIPSNTTGVTITDTTSPYNTNNLNVAFVTQVVPRTGAFPNFGYGPPILSINPNDKYNAPTQGGFIPAPGWQPWAPGANLAWCFNSGAPDPNGFPLNYVRFVPMPTQPVTVVYDALRYPYVMSDTSPVDESQIPDLPTHFGPNLVRRLLKECYIRAGLDIRELNAEILDMDTKSYAVESQGVQRQRTDAIRNYRGY